MASVFRVLVGLYKKLNGEHRKLALLQTIVKVSLTEWEKKKPTFRPTSEARDFHESLPLSIQCWMTWFHVIGVKLNLSSLLDNAISQSSVFAKILIF
jgi:hypothetical protein